MSWIDVLGYAASASVLATFCMSAMLPLRITAIGSNILFISSGALDHVYPVFVLHVVLLPVNIVRLVQLLRPIPGVSAAHLSNPSVPRFPPFISQRFVRAGQVLMKGVGAP